MPDEWAEFPHQSLILGYINSYADRFNLRDQILNLIAESTKRAVMIKVVGS